MLPYEKWEKILEQGFDLNIIFLLELIQHGYKIDSRMSKVTSYIQLMKRRGLITDDSKLSTEGVKLIEFYKSDNEELSLLQKDEKDDIFNKWWEAYPSTNGFTISNRKFEGTRSLKSQKEKCFEKYHKILLKGDYTSDELLNALNLEVTVRRTNSLKKKVNEMTYMHNSLTYLNQEDYTGFVEMIRSKEPLFKDSGVSEISDNSVNI